MSARGCQCVTLDEKRADTERGRPGSNRIVFTPYKWQELEQIMEARLGEELKTQIFAPRAIEHIAKKVAAGAGDARRALDIAR